MLEKVIEKLDAIEASSAAKLAETAQAVEAKVAEAVEAVKTETEAKIAALEAKVAAPSIIRPIHKTVRGEANRRFRDVLKEYVKAGNNIEREIKIFESVDQCEAYINEASALTGSGYDVGGRTAYDPVFAAKRLGNPLLGLSRIVATDGSAYQFRVKTGNAGAQWGYTVQNNGASTTEATSIWQVILKDLNAQFPIRTAALDDIDGLEPNVVDDMLMEFQHYTGGSCSTASFGTSGTATSNGLHNLATYDQLTTNANTVAANNIVYKDVVNFIYSLPQQYWTPTAAFMINPILLQGIRGLVDSQLRPIYIDGLSRTDGIVGELLGFKVVVNKYVDNPSQPTAGAAGTTSYYPMYFADWQQFHTMVMRLSMVLRRYDQTLPGSITFYGETRAATSVRDPNAGVRYRSTGTAA
ncbi:MAG: phage major capsid protein [Betaproteobacteria bacterium]|nr:phage major capsid protein [Betaproteobacteria bacterium]